MLDDFTAEGIPRDAMEAAITLVQYYVDEWVRLCGSCEEPSDIVLAKKLVKWLAEKKLHHIYLAQVYQKGPYGIRDRRTALDVITILEGHHILTRVPEGMSLEDKDRADVWKVHHG